MSLKSKWESAKRPIRDILTIAGLGRLASELWPWIGGGLTVFLSWFANEPLVTIWVYGLVALVALVWARNGLHWWKVQHPSPSQSSAPALAESTDESHAARQFFVGQWKCGHGDPNLPTFILTLNDDGTVRKSHVPKEVGRWGYANGAARINTSDHWRDTLRRTPEGVVKFAYDESSGPLSDEKPSNSSLATKQPAPT